ncbi:MAG TPA: HDOD domain-containing protein [Nitrospirota bacterium]|nr:HDOD domain-containing protein [Nitrospirota bacterium]
MDEQDVKRYINRLGDLSTTPTLLSKILALAGDDTKSIDDFSDLISCDQALAQRVLKVANSAFFAHSGQITNINQALLFLGLDRIKSIAVGMSVMNIFPAGGTFKIENLWMHGYEVAMLSALLSECVAVTQPQDSFLAGLLHDIGRIILYNLDHDLFQAIETTDSMLEQEKDLYACTHAQAGAWFAEEVGMPGSIVNAIKYHHSPSLAPDDMNLVSLVSLAEGLTRMFTPRVEDDGIWTREHDAILLEFSLAHECLQAIGAQMVDMQKDIERIFAAT